MQKAFRKGTRVLGAAAADDEGAEDINHAIATPRHCKLLQSFFSLFHFRGIKDNKLCKSCLKK